MTRAAAAIACAIVLVVVAGACARDDDAEPAAATPPTRAQIVVRVPAAVSMQRVRAHLAALQRIADRNRGTRAAGTPGYRASVAYVREQLTQAGYRARVEDFPFVEYTEVRETARQVSPRRRSLKIEAIDYSPSTPAGGTRGELIAADDGCEQADFAAVRGKIALAQRGTCFIAVKAQNARAAGALALIVFSPEPGPIDATLGDPNASAIPVVAIDRSLARSLQAGRPPVLELEVTTRKRASASQNVISDSRPAARRVLVVGAHLDSVRAGPGINDNGTGVAALLEIARVVRQVAPRLSVRFAFWGAEEFGLIGSRAYVQGADTSNIAGYLNFDMLGSGSAELLVYEGTFAARWMTYFTNRGLPAQTVDLTGRSDHFPFAQRGIPTGGLFAGIDRCYHAACDRLASVNANVLQRLARAAAYGVAAFAPLQQP